MIREENSGLIGSTALPSGRRLSATLRSRRTASIIRSSKWETLVKCNGLIIARFPWLSFDWLRKRAVIYHPYVSRYILEQQKKQVSRASLEQCSVAWCVNLPFWRLQHHIPCYLENRCFPVLPATDTSLIIHILRPTPSDRKIAVRTRIQRASHAYTAALWDSYSLGL